METSAPQRPNEKNFTTRYAGVHRGTEKMTNSFHPPASYRKTFHEFLIRQGLHLVPVFPLKGLMPYDKFVKHWFLSEMRGKLLMNFTPSCILSQSPCLRGRNHFPYALAYELPANHSRLLSQKISGSAPWHLPATRRLLQVRCSSHLPQ